MELNAAATLDGLGRLDSVGLHKLKGNLRAPILTKVGTRTAFNVSHESRESRDPNRV
jgi:hypothetical protein